MARTSWRAYARKTLSYLGERYTRCLHLSAVKKAFEEESAKYKPCQEGIDSIDYIDKGSASPMLYTGGPKPERDLTKDYTDGEAVNALIEKAASKKENTRKGRYAHVFWTALLTIIGLSSIAFIVLWVLSLTGLRDSVEPFFSYMGDIISLDFADESSKMPIYFFVLGIFWAASLVLSLLIYLVARPFMKHSLNKRTADEVNRRAHERMAKYRENAERKKALDAIIKIMDDLLSNEWAILLEEADSAPIPYPYGHDFIAIMTLASIIGSNPKAVSFSSAVKIYKNQVENLVCLEKPEDFLRLKSMSRNQKNINEAFDRYKIILASNEDRLKRFESEPWGKKALVDIANSSLSPILGYPPIRIGK
jgi:hypothetical protein